ncbi:Hint domain-containing protein [Planktomarina temperata]|nr:Hint domain-containing protein [Planktomarina temperata]
MASSFGSFVSASDFSFATNLTTTNGAQTLTTINWNFASSVVEVRNLSSGTGNYAGALSRSDTLGNYGNHAPIILGSTNPTFAALANTGTRFISGNPYDANNPGSAARIEIRDPVTNVVAATITPVYLLDGSNNLSAFQGYFVSSRSEYLELGKQYRVIYTTFGTSSNIRIADGLTFCFLSGTRIAVPLGETPVEQLRVGDTVLTGNGPQAVSWISSSRKNGANTPPVVFTPAAFASGALATPEGARLPERPLKVSQQHCMVLKDQRARAFLGTDRFLLAAKHLVNGDTIYLDHSAGDLEYFHLMFDQYQIVLAEGAWSESFYPGTEALKALTMTQVRDVYEIAPDLMDDPASGYGPTALPRLTGGEYKRMLMGKGPTPGQRQRRLAADDLRAQRLDVSVAGYGAPFALPVQPSAHKSMAAHSK